VNIRDLKYLTICSNYFTKSDIFEWFWVDLLNKV